MSIVRVAEEAYASPVVGTPPMCCDMSGRLTWRDEFLTAVSLQTPCFRMFNGSLNTIDAGVVKSVRDTFVDNLAAFPFKFQCVERQLLESRVDQ